MNDIHSQEDIRATILPPQPIVETKTKKGRKPKKHEAEQFNLDFGTIPPILPRRNKFGLLDNVKYEFDQNGYINWRRLVRPEYLVPNSLNFTKRGEEVPTSIEGLKDEDLIIKLAGLKELLNVRGYENVSYVIASASLGFVSVVCKISYIPNYETAHRFVSYEAIGDASTDSVSGIFQNFLGAIAENRAFSRCIRSFLRINIVSDEEMTNNNSKSADSGEANESQVQLLRDLLDKKKLTLDDLKEKLYNEGLKEAKEITDLKQIPKNVIFSMIDRLKKYNPVPE